MIYALLAALLSVPNAKGSPFESTQVSEVPPRLDLHPKGILDLGSLGPRGTRIAHYRFRNTSSKGIRLHLLESSEGMIVQGITDRHPILPGEERVVSVRIDALERTGNHLLRARLGTDDPMQGHYILPIRVSIRPDVAVQPVRQELLGIHPSRPQTATFQFSRETGEVFRIEPKSHTANYLVSKVTGEGSQLRLEVTLDPECVPAGMRMGLETIDIRTTAPHQPEFTLYLAWSLCFDVDAKPTRLVFLDPSNRDGEVMLVAAQGKPFMVERIWIEGGGFELEPHSPPIHESNRVIRVRRTTEVSSKALLRVRFKNGLAELRVPIHYLPPS